MGFMQLVSLIEEAYTLVQQLKANGTLAKLQAAEQAVLAEFENNPLVKDLIAKIKMIKV